MTYNTPVAGIVAEYNPLHKGHLHHISATRQMMPRSPIIVVLSSCFVQRGEPSFLDPWSRAEAALEAGADLVLHLPVAFSCHQAQVFASAAVDILAATGVVTHLSFGMEGHKELLKKAGSILIQEPPSFKMRLRRWLDQGFSFVEARSRALEEMEPGLGSFLKGSNNILALAYHMRIAQRKLPIETISVKRIGAAYNQRDFDQIPSATAVRTLWEAGDRERALRGLPPFSARILEREDRRGRVVTTSNPRWWDLLRWRILSTPEDQMISSAEMAEGLENGLKRAAREAESYQDLLESTVSRRYPRSRIQRLCCHLMLSHQHWFNRACQRLGPSWIGVLATNDLGKGLLRRMRSTAELPVLSRFTSPPDGYSRGILALEERALTLWEILAGNPKVDSFRRRRIMMSPSNPREGSSPEVA